MRAGAPASSFVSVHVASNISPRERRLGLVRLGVCCLLLLTACQAGKAPGIHPKLNPSVQTGREIAFRFSDPPGAIHQPGAALFYAVTNQDCVPIGYKRALGGVRRLPRYRLAAPVVITADHAYIVTAWDGALVDENYFGLGTCRWALQSVTFTFSSDTGARFVAPIAADALREGDDVGLRYLASDFERGAARDPAIFGERPDYYPRSKPQVSLAIATHEVLAR